MYTTKVFWCFGILTSGGIISRIFNVDTRSQSHVPAAVIRSEKISYMYFNRRRGGHQSLPSRFVERYSSFAAAGN